MTLKNTFLLRRNFLTILVFTILKNSNYAQSHEEGYGAGGYFIDKEEYFKTCTDSLRTLQYYSLHIKHPKSAQKLLKEVRQFYKKPQNNTQSGYITVRFIVNYEGKPHFFKTYEIDENYHVRAFDSSISEQLKNFVKQLGDWKIGQYDGKLCNYFYYFSFKIQNGEIQNIIP